MAAKTSSPNSGKPGDSDPLSARQREAAAYIADLSISLRNTAHVCMLPFLAHLLDMVFYEAYTAAHGTEPFLPPAAPPQTRDTN